MPIYLAALSLKAERHDYSHLWQSLTGTHAYHLMDSTWLVDVAQDALTVTNAILSYCAVGDRLLVLEFVAGAAWTGTGLGTEAKTWLSRRMIVSKTQRPKRRPRPKPAPSAGPSAS